MDARRLALGERISGQHGDSFLNGEKPAQPPVFEREEGDREVPSRRVDKQFSHMKGGEDEQGEEDELFGTLEFGPSWVPNLSLGPV